MEAGVQLSELGLLSQIPHYVCTLYIYNKLSQPTNKLLSSLFFYMSLIT